MVVAHAGVVSAFSIVLGMRTPDSPRRDIPNATPLIFEYKGAEVKKSYKIVNPVSSRKP